MRAIRKKILSYCLAICTIMLFATSSLVLAETGIPTIMDGLTTRIIDLHPSFADRIVGAKNTNINVNVLTSATEHEKNVYEQAQQWKNNIKPKIEMIQNQVLSYNPIFRSKYNDVQTQIHAKNKEQLLKLLVDMQSNITSKKKGVTEFLTTLRTFRNDVTTNVQQLQTDCLQVQASMDGYRATLDALYDQLYVTTSESVREQLENQTAEVSVKLYDNLEPLYNQMNTIIDSLNGVNDGILNVGWLISLEDMNTNWTTLESKLQSLSKNLTDASDINWAFISDDMNVVQKTWDDIYNKTKQL
ncbi:HBL/NHE enterotoxin family protein [Bacillus toyonensis]|uniref:HBL/NHE enterotoxin family protein n=1 Tax=Bacillus toyonensis TaxID=155322 RepID=UPI0015D4B073|nr:HBL/NHE enterotoxin family protein [Bacillus toyonensis]